MIIEANMVCNGRFEYILTYNNGEKRYALGSSQAGEIIEKTDEPVEFDNRAFKDNNNLLKIINEHNQELKQRESQGGKAK